MTKFIPFLPSQIKIKDEVTFMNPTAELIRIFSEKITKIIVLSCGNPKCYGKIELKKMIQNQKSVLNVGMKLIGNLLKIFKDHKM